MTTTLVYPVWNTEVGNSTGLAPGLFSAPTFAGGGSSPVSAFSGAITGPAIGISPGMTGGPWQITDAMPGHSQTGGVAMQFVMDGSWAGSITLACRSAVYDAALLNPAFVGPWPFHAFYLNGSGSTGAIVSGGSAIITDTSNILVPTSGNMLAISVDCTAGSAILCYQPVSGSTTP